MRKIILSLATLSLFGCATNAPVGIIYTGATLPINATPTVEATKTGEACSSSWFALVAVGDSSINQAKKNGGITNVSTIDFKINNVLGVYGSYCTTVTGN